MVSRLELYPATAITRMKHIQAAARRFRTVLKLNGGGSGFQSFTGSSIWPAMTAKVDAPKIDIVRTIVTKIW